MFLIHEADLHRFDGEGAPGAAPAEGASTSPDAEGVNQAEQANPDQEYLDFIKTHKQQYDKDVQRIIGKRFKTAKQIEARQAAMQPVMDLLSSRYSTDDPGKLLEAINADDQLWADAADEAGMSIEQYKEVQRLKSQNAALLKAQKDQQSAQQEAEQLEKWNQEATALKAAYPDFDLSAAVDNPYFASALKVGWPMQMAYQAAFYDQLSAGTAADAEKRTVETIRAGRGKPAENGLSGKGGQKLGNRDISKLGNDEIDDILRRVSSGEKISL